MSGRAEVKHVPKPWGHETIWAHTDRYVGKILHINAGESLSVQYHNHKDETVPAFGERRTGSSVVASEGHASRCG